MTVHHMPARGSNPTPIEVPLVVYIKDGRMVDSELEGDRVVVGTAVVRGSQVEMTLFDQIPPEVMDTLVGENRSVSFSLGPLNSEDSAQGTLFPIRKDWYGKR